MLTYHIFLASSSELEPDRKSFEIFISRLNTELKHQNKHVEFELKIWEHVDNAIYDTRKQDQYNEYLETCDLFVLLYWTKMGRFSEEEFDRAYKRFKETGKPKIYTYKKTIDQPATVTDANQQSLSRFDKKLHETIVHFTDTYETGIDLTAKFKTEIDKLFATGYLQYGQPAICLSAGQSAVPATFIGREEELKVIRERLDKGGKLLLINAEGGMGKTSIAAKYWQESLYRYNYNAWLFCENGIVEEIKKLAPKLNIDLAEYKTEQEQLLALKTALENTPGDCLLVLDNVNNPKDIHVFRQYFEGIHWHVLFTSRCKGVLPDPKTNEYQIPHLPPPLAMDLFIHNYKEDNSSFESKLDQLLQAIGYNTLLIDLFSKNLKQSSVLGDDLESFLNRLETGGLFLRERSFEINTDYTTHHIVKEAATTDDIIEALYDLTKLEENERYWLVNLSLMPAITHTVKFLIELFKPEDEFGFKKILDKLAKYGWLNTDTQTYRISPVIQKIILEKNQAMLPEDCKKIVEILNMKLANDNIYLTNLKEQEAQPLTELAVHVASILKSNPQENIGTLCLNLAVFYNCIGNFSSALMSAEEYKIICQQIKNKNGLAIAYLKLGDTYTSIGERDKALIFYELSNLLEIELHEEYPNDAIFKDWLAISYEKLGEIHASMGSFEKALGFYELDNQISKEIYENDSTNIRFKNGLSISYEKLGQTHASLNNLQTALRFYEQYNNLQKELYSEDANNVKFKSNFAISNFKLGDIYASLGNLDKTLRLYEYSIRLEKELCHENPNNVRLKNNLTISYSRLGDIHTSLGNLNEALSFYGEYKILAKELHEYNPENRTYKNSLAISCFQLGETYNKLGKSFKALNYFEEFLQLSKSLFEYNPQNTVFKNLLTIANERILDTKDRLSNLEKTLNSYISSLKAKEGLSKYDPINVIEEFRIRCQIGRLNCDLGNEIRADLSFQEATQVLTRVKHDRGPARRKIVVLYVADLVQLELACCMFKSALNTLKQVREVLLSLVEDNPDPDDFYDLSCILAYMSKAALAITDKHENNTSVKYIEESISWLDKSLKAGYNNFAHLLSDVDLDPIRQHPAYVALVNSLN